MTYHCTYTNGSVKGEVNIHDDGTSKTEKILKGIMRSLKKCKMKMNWEVRDDSK